MPGAKKEELRRAARRIRDAIPPERRAEAAESAAGHLLALPGLAAARTVALFAAVGSELDAGPAVRGLRARGVEIAYPRVGRASGQLEFCLVADDREPAPGAAAAPVASIDAFVLPGLAFDAGGARVGWGRGYYDRALAAEPERLRIGYCFACQVVDEVPLEPSDLPVHVLVTESGVLVPA